MLVYVIMDQSGFAQGFYQGKPEINDNCQKQNFYRLKKLPLKNDLLVSKVQVI